MHPSVSIIIPTYNRAICIGRAIESVLAQTFTRYEIIVVDDGSTDNTQAVLEAYEDKIRYIPQENAGVSAARNRGIQAAKAEWIAFLDSDDQWFSDYLASQIECIEQNAKVIAHITNAVTLYPDGREEIHFLGTGLQHEFGGTAPMLLQRPLCTVLRHAPWFVQASVMRRTGLLECGLFNPRLRIAEDFDLFARMARKGPFCIHNRVLVGINRNDELFDHLSKQVFNKEMETLEVYADIIKRLRVSEDLDVGEKKALAFFLSSNKRALGNLLLKTGKRNQARALFLQALLIHPHWKTFAKYLISYLPGKAARLFMRKGKRIALGHASIFGKI